MSNLKYFSINVNRKHRLLGRPEREVFTHPYDVRRTIRVIRRTCHTAYVSYGVCVVRVRKNFFLDPPDYYFTCKKMHKHKIDLKPKMKMSAKKYNLFKEPLNSCNLGY